MLKLEIELVPEPLWGVNLRSNLTQTQWKRVRQEAIARGVGDICKAGGAGLPLHAHERWAYDDTGAVARLTGVGSVCRACHAVAHFRATQRIAAEKGYASMVDDAIAHSCRVNGVVRKAFRAHSAAAFALHEQRNAREWAVDWGAFAGQVADVAPKRAARAA
jgi:hypothetical protein